MTGQEKKDSDGQKEGDDWKEKSPKIEGGVEGGGQKVPEKGAREQIVDRECQPCFFCFFFFPSVISDG